MSKMTHTYILDSTGKPVPEPDTRKWGRWSEGANELRRVASQEIGLSKVRVSTVFLAIDHNFTGGEPVLYETMVFGGSLDGETNRYHNREEALVGHEAMCERVREAGNEQNDTMNIFGVGRSGQSGLDIKFAYPPSRLFSSKDALNMAAWLVVMAESEEGEFDKLLEAVKAI